jgi:hypothetical protein
VSEDLLFSCAGELSERCQELLFDSFLDVYASVRLDPDIANESIGGLKEFDANLDAFVCLAHDPSLFEVLPL